MQNTKNRRRIFPSLSGLFMLVLLKSAGNSSEKPVSMAHVAGADIAVLAVNRHL